MLQRPEGELSAGIVWKGQVQSGAPRGPESRGEVEQHGALLRVEGRGESIAVVHEGASTQ
jgi:hypothetical protein